MCVLGGYFILGSVHPLWLQYVYMENHPSDGNHRYWRRDAAFLVLRQIIKCEVLGRAVAESLEENVPRIILGRSLSALRSAELAS